jgi:long-chain acyl-CoA synthetase
LREFSIPALAEIPDTATLTDTVFGRPDQNPDAVIMRKRVPVLTDTVLTDTVPTDTVPTGTGHTWAGVTAASFRDEVRTLAKGLLAAGVGQGDRVGLMARTSYAWTLADYAIWTAGAVTVPVYETSSAEQVEWILSNAGCRAVFAESEAHAATITSVKGNVPELENIWPMDSVGAITADGADVPDGDLDARMAARRADDLATIIYTSGTTGRPKGCELTHRNLLSGARNAADGALHELFETEGSSTLLFLPLAHSFARIIQVACIEGGAVLQHWEDSATLAQALPETKPLFLLAVPRVFEKVFNSAQQQAAASAAKSRIFRAATETAIAHSRAQSTPGGGPVTAGAGQGLRLRHALFDRLVYAKLRAAVGGRVTYAISGGAPLGERLGHFFRGAGITVLEGYGLTETSAAAMVNRPSRNKIGTVGLPIPGTTVKIADDGEILISGPIVFRGYWGNEEATAETLDADGWLHTGDIGALDHEGFLTVTGRKKELIVTAGGKNVAPAVLEDRLRAHPLVSQCMVVGDNRPFVGCLITLDSEALEFWKQQHGKPAGASAADLAGDPDLVAELQSAVDDANKAVSRAESIRKFRILDTDFTEASGHLTPSLKVKRSVVAKDYAQEIELLYARG